MTTSRIVLAAALFALSLTAACATEDASDDGATSDGVWVIEEQFHVDTGLPMSVVVEVWSGDDRFAPAEADPIESSICECTTDECTRAWVIEQIGCGACVDTTCADGSHRGTCVPCDAE